MVRERVERGETQPTPPRGSLSVAELRQLISMMHGSDIEEVAIEHEEAGLKLALRKLGAQPGATAATAEVESYEGTEVEDEEPVAVQSGVEVRSSLVGVFRVAMKAGGAPLAALGDVVREGQVVGAIEALNVLNEVEVSAPGRVSDILVSDGQAVEYGQPLLIVEAL